ISDEKFPGGALSDFMPRNSQDERKVVTNGNRSFLGNLRWSILPQGHRRSRPSHPSRDCGAVNRSFEQARLASTERGTPAEGCPDHGSWPWLMQAGRRPSRRHEQLQFLLEGVAQPAKGSSGLELRGRTSNV